MPLAALALLAVIQAATPAPVRAADPRSAAWTGVWKPTDPANPARLTVLTVDATGLTLDLDEGLGRHGQREQGAAAWAGSGRVRLGLSDCAGTLTLRPGGRWGTEIYADFEGCFIESDTELVFIREEIRLDHPTSFDCARAEGPLERAICADEGLAAADRRLARVYQATLDRAGDRKDEVRRDQRAWLGRRQGTCRAGGALAGCIMESIGHRLLELRAWPDAAFRANRQPDVAVITRVLTTPPDAVADSGVRELLCGSVPCDPAALTLGVYPERGGVAVMGWTLGNSNETSGVYLAFRTDGSIWTSAWNGGEDPAAVTPRPKRGQRLPESLQSFRVDGPVDDAGTIEDEQTARRARDWVGHWTSTGDSSAAIDISHPDRGTFSLEWREGDGLRADSTVGTARWEGDREAVLDRYATSTQCRLTLTPDGQLQAVFPSDACFGSGDHWRRPFVRKESKRP
jgi:uncharacterized protein YecT (DUF1311 family)